MELEEAIKMLKECKVMDVCTTKYDLDLMDYEQAIEIVLQELENKDKEIQDLKAINAMQEYRINEMDIPKKKIEDKIEEYEKLIDDISESEQYSHEIPLYKHDIQVLQELLEDNK